MKEGRKRRKERKKERKKEGGGEGREGRREKKEGRRREKKGEGRKNRMGWRDCSAVRTRGLATLSEGLRSIPRTYTVAQSHL